MLHDVDCIDNLATFTTFNPLCIYPALIPFHSRASMGSMEEHSFSATVESIPVHALLLDFDGMHFEMCALQ